MQFSAKQIAALVNGEIQGNPETVITKMARIEDADNSSIAFISNPKYFHYAETTNAAIVLVDAAFEIPVSAKATFIKVPNAYQVLPQLLEQFSQASNQKTGIEQPSFMANDVKQTEGLYLGAFAYVGKGVKLGKNVKIYPNSYIGDNSVIGDNTIIYSGVNIYHETVIGNNCIIHSGVVLGGDGFGFAPNEKGEFKKIPQTGNVVLGNHVEIGANTVVDRASLGSTEIKQGVKLDNLVQVAHNVEIGANTVVAAQAGISGSTKLGKHVMVGGQAGFVGHITIADGVKINAQSGVSKSVKQAGKALSGSPAEAFNQNYKHIALTRKLPELVKRIEELEKQVNS